MVSLADDSGEGAAEADTAFTAPTVPNPMNAIAATFAPIVIESVIPF
jgi:hypothetical protein